MRCTNLLKAHEEREDNLTKLKITYLQYEKLATQCQLTLLAVPNLPKDDKTKITKAMVEARTAATACENIEKQLLAEEQQFQQELIDMVLPEMEEVRGAKYSAQEKPFVKQSLQTKIDDVIYYARKIKESAEFGEQYTDDYDYIIRAARHTLIRNAELFLLAKIPNHTVPASFRVYEKNMMDASIAVVSGATLFMHAPQPTSATAPANRPASPGKK